MNSNDRTVLPVPATPPMRRLEPHGMPGPRSSSSLVMCVLQRACGPLDDGARRIASRGAKISMPLPVMRNGCSSRLWFVPRILMTLNSRCCSPSDSRCDRTSRPSTIEKSGFLS